MDKNDRDLFPIREGMLVFAQGPRRDYVGKIREVNHFGIVLEDWVWVTRLPKKYLEFLANGWDDVLFDDPIRNKRAKDPITFAEHWIFLPFGTFEIQPFRHPIPGREPNRKKKD